MTLLLILAGAIAYLVAATIVARQMTRWLAERGSEPTPHADGLAGIFYGLIWPVTVIVAAVILGGRWFYMWATEYDRR